MDNTHTHPIPSLNSSQLQDWNWAKLQKPARPYARTYVRSASARDYLIYGCIGLLDLYTGPHLIVIASVKALGDIEDKPVFAIDKVAILPMEVYESQLVLDRLAQFIDPSGGPVSTSHIDRGSESSSTLATPVPEPDTDYQAAIAVPDTTTIPVKSPKIRFSFLGLKHDKTLQKSASTPNIPSQQQSEAEARATSPIMSSLSPKRVSFEVPRLDAVDGKESTSVQQPTASSTVKAPSGFFSKLLEKKPRKSIDRTVPQSEEVNNNGTQLPVPNQVNNETTAEVTVEQIRQDGTPAPPVITIDTNVVGDSLLPAGVRSPMDEVEQFMVNSKKKLADWSDEAVAGVLKTSASLSKSINDLQEKDNKGAQEIVATAIPAISATAAVIGGGEEFERNKSLDRRVIREMSSIFGTGFYFSTEFDLLSSMQKRSDFAREQPAADIPLWCQVDKRFWWNEHLSKEFLDIKAHGYVLPIMQGYVEIEQCEIEEQPFEFTLVSRRSKYRSGLRYQRRGIDEQGNTANFVETEQLLRITPIPVLERTEEENMEGFQKHVSSQMDKYGRQIFISLVEQHGREVIAGSAYTQYVEKLAEPQVRYVQFDFHEQCRGMKYENIDRLIKSLEVPIQELGYCWLAPRNDGVTRDDDGFFERLYEQKGVIRTNCMDCLDRTNVVQSAIGRHILNHQLLRLGIASFPDKGLSVYEDFENVFNHVWANNGDAISREYAGTSALKGDFTRTGKRNLQGMVNDATNSIARMYQNTFKDYFRQAAIDYLLGVEGVEVFKNLQTTAFGTAVVPPPILPPPISLPEPQQSNQIQIQTSASTPALSALARESVTAGSKSEGLLPSLIPLDANQQGRNLGDEKAEDAWVRIREAAIETSAEIVISPGEERWKGWTFICCSNEISSALTSASSPYSSPSQRVNGSPKKKSPWSKVIPAVIDAQDPKKDALKEDVAPVFYDEKIVLLTEKALYICTYDYEMEKVLEFWRLALEKMTGIDKGAYFLTAQDKTKMGLDPLENYGFAVIYRASAAGETLRVNSGSVRNRRMMGGANRTPDLDLVQEVDEVNGDLLGGPQQADKAGVETDFEDGRSAKSILRNEVKEFNTVRFKIVKHPVTSIVPYVTSSTVDSGQSKANPSGYRRTAQDCVEWVVTEIVQARCELISVAEKDYGSDAIGAVYETPPTSSTQNLQVKRISQHGASPSEEYSRLSSVQVDLVIRDRVLQSLEVAAQLEAPSLKNLSSNPDTKKPKKSLSAFFTSASSSIGQTNDQRQLMPPASNNKSWLKKFSFGNSSSTEEDFSEDEDEALEQRRNAKVVKESGPSLNKSERLGLMNTEAQQAQQTSLVDSEADGASSLLSSPSQSLIPGTSNRRNSGNNGGVFAKFKQAVKNL
ncbi:hypothetical protein BGZ83_007325 [Gryganskiella cystojenkinii]|nr:hypothetical protein BGZ83_007325 [Gryganskiella cystojenkinii]